MLFDTHAHLNDPAYAEDLESVVETIRESEINKVLNCGYDRRSSEQAVALAEQYDFMYAAVGMHPHDAKDYDDSFELQITNWLSHPRVVALGEAGLDYHYDYSPREIQRDVFVRQIKLAARHQMPLVIHSREAVQDTYDLLHEHLNVSSGGLLHSFSQSMEMMKQYLDMGLYFSISGVVTFKNAHNVRETVEQMPLDRMMIETDSPYMAPVPHRGKRNVPQYVRYVAETVANIKNITYEEVAEQTFHNAMDFFHIDKK